MKLECKCDWCGKKFFRDPSHIKGRRHLFCSKQCVWDFSNKTKNPGKYTDLKNYEPMSKHLSALNRELNPQRMTYETRTKLRNANLNSGEAKSYSKLYGRHEHRVVAESILGRPLQKGEVVHHLDFNPRNNDPENLMIFPSQADHAKYHAALDAFFNTGLLRTEEEEVVPNEVHAT